MTDLLPAIPDPRREMVPPGWLDEFVPAVDSIDEPAADEDGNDVSSGDADADPDSATA